MGEKISIFSTEVRQISETINEFLIYPKDYKGGSNINMFDLQGIFDYTKNLQPQRITIIGTNIHARDVVAFLEYFLSRKYKPFVYELSIKRTIKKNRYIIIKLQKLN